MTPDFLSLHDYRVRAAELYRERNRALDSGELPELICDRFRAGRDELFATHSQSALTAGAQRSFTGLDYYPYRPDACVEACIEATTPEVMNIQTGTGELITLSAAAAVDFEFRHRRAALLVYWIDVYGGGLFLPFRDTTAPENTYGGGRYLIDTIKGSDFRWAPGNSKRIYLDFNYAYNPSCAYDPRWSCPLAPPANRLDFPIPAGEKRFRPLGVSP